MVSAMLAAPVFVGLLYALIVAAHIMLPARTVLGYVCDATQPDKRLTYRLNGLRCLVVFAGAAAALAYSGFEGSLAILSFLHENFGACALVGNCIGLYFSYYTVYVRWARLPAADQKANEGLRAPTWPPKTKPAGESKTVALDQRGSPFYFGKEFNPRMLGGSFDVKMFLYIIGAVVLELNVISALVVERGPDGAGGFDGGRSSRAMLTYAALMTWFVCEYMFFERIHLYTYDLFAEKIGFKLVWGCLCFYPFFYAIGTLPVTAAALGGGGAAGGGAAAADANSRDLSPTGQVCTIALFFAGWLLTRGANLQKYWWRRFPEERAVMCGLVRQATVAGSGDRLLCSGFWGVSRHVNYLGEIVQGVALALPGFLVAQPPEAGPWSRRMMPFVALLYPVYYVLLFVGRQIDDDALLRRRYGDKVMDAYIRAVPYRIVPGIY